jgi:hypothetical protein
MGLLSKSSSARPSVERLRQAEVMLASFARSHHGVFILDGPAIGTDADRTPGPELDVYCWFESPVMGAGIAAAKTALAPFRDWQISYHRGDAFVGELLTYISRRAHVLGDRRKRKR